METEELEETFWRLSWRTRISFLLIIAAVIYFFVGIDVMPYSMFDDLAVIVTALLVFLVFVYIDFKGGDKHGKKKKK